MAGAGHLFHDLDHVVIDDGRIYRVLGNLDSNTHFLGYNVYMPSEDGDRVYRGRTYKKRFIEDEDLPADVLDTYELIPIEKVIDHLDPIQSAKTMCGTFEGTVWFDLYVELCEVFGDDSVGIFGSSMFGLHLTPEGKVRKDVDFVLEGVENIPTLRQTLPEIRKRLGFTEVSPRGSSANTNAMLGCFGIARTRSAR
ncbi:hypothetical protein [Kutzneria chonburiensis]|uniref:hypothetical protein n=1 Tax=Kutzneria chonburiensis TaxID=1483604 RepID=UPI002361ABD5|nr:hypothetical protein [Kutzneria chonburiensis]